MRFCLNFLLLLSITCLLLNCKSDGKNGQKIEASLKSLQDDEAKIMITIDGKAFYPEQSIFHGSLMLSNQMLSVTLTDQYEGKTMLTIGGEGWYKQKPVTRNISLATAFEGSLKLGKLIDPKNMIGEGYMMSEGTIEVADLTKEKVVITIKGKVGKYSDFNQPDKYLPIEGLIVYKKPAFSLANVREEEIFSPAEVR